MAKEWYVSLLVPEGKKVVAKTEFIKLGDKSDKTDVRNQISRMYSGAEILSISETGAGKPAYSKEELKKLAEG